ncbi:tRNA (N6-isopentenyl adenosine(37)-C2)-methylthiotransferase MiaB [Amaricoccus solimangrovi]|uniref:tRNA-2-methylthio-N(6)-dimethylallyladenosine synthase n=1 Tax=Amaricoccus solimangrovi TaxID=2589815 RepID=A0A501WWE8_9RHOB|nr:tRNA (N6-isopentenyl adenosine(37)-C2)-methylthiotransferase MiaB [Amaricoccus solimangrovi]TPE50206.1 tRNA (N6-isopentenyl adenosine(37)-C2)-methylthiotransferase MiaB [Amaricoccus solimangrovi]
MSAPVKKLFVKTYGCQMNVYDSERMTSALATRGYEATETAEDADLILLNTCHIREKAAEKVYSDIGRLRPLKAARPDLRIGVTGCVAQAEGGEILRRTPLVDLVVGPQAYHRLPGMLDRIGEGERPVDTDFPAEDKFDHLPEAPRARRAPTAFLTVQEGCDKFCAFCVVPYTRGAEVSRPAGRLLAEARDLVARGVAEITLLGQNVNAYRDENGETLAGLIGELAAIEGLERIRYTTSHPNDMGADLIAAHGAEPKLMPFLHLPVQSGSDRILKAMNRRHTAEQYLRLIERIRAARPDIALSGDFITGFPGETEADFAETLALVEAVNYAQAFSFAYSPRPGTPAAGREDLPREVKAERLRRLQELLGRQQAAFQASMVGRDLAVLVEKPGREPGQVAGKSPYLNAIQIDAGAETIGRVVRARVTASGRNSLFGDLLDAA